MYCYIRTYCRKRRACVRSESLGHCQQMLLINTKDYPSVRYEAQREKREGIQISESVCVCVCVCCSYGRSYTSVIQS